MLCFGLCACGDSGSTSEIPSHVGKTDWYMGGQKLLGENMDVEGYFAAVEDTIDPAKIYQATELTEGMLYGCYTLNNREKDIESVREQIPFEDVAFKLGTSSLTILPTAVYFGSEYICNTLTRFNYSEFTDITDAEVAVLEFTTADKLG